MCTVAVARTATLSHRITHPPAHRPPRHATRSRRRQACPCTCRRQVPKRNGTLSHALHLAARTRRMHKLLRPLSSARRHRRHPRATNLPCRRRNRLQGLHPHRRRLNVRRRRAVPRQRRRASTSSRRCTVRAPSRRSGAREPACASATLPAAPQ
eukprot:5260276-Prymnesium_polylepis.1